MNVGIVQNVQPYHRITTYFMGELETVDSKEVAVIPPAYEPVKEVIQGNLQRTFAKIPVERRIKMPGMDFSAFRKKILSWSAFEDQQKQSRPPALPPIAEALPLRETPWRARQDSEGNYHPCSCCPDCAKQAKRDQEEKDKEK